MVVNDSKSLFSLIDNFNPNNQDHLLKLEELSKNYPNFHLVRAYYLKALQKQEVSSFDKILSLRFCWAGVFLYCEFSIEFSMF